MIKILILNINKNPLSAAPSKGVRYLLLHATHSLCASLRSFKSVCTLSRVPRSDRVPTNKKSTMFITCAFSNHRLSISAA